MKTRKIITIALALMSISLLQSCEKTYLYGRLSFEAPKVVEGQEETSMAERAIGIYATKDSQPFFDGKKYFYDGHWQYENPLHWTNANYKFIFIHPYSDSLYKWNPAKNELSYNYSYKYPYNEIFLYSSEERTYDGSDYSSVPVEMEHLSCILHVNIYNYTSQDPLAIRKCELFDFKYKGSCKINMEGKDIYLSDTICYQSEERFTNLPSPSYIESEEKIDAFPQGVIVPEQVLQWPYLVVNTRENNKDVVRTIALKEESGIQKWERGKNYTYSVYIYDNSIGFSVSVEKWTDITVNL